MNSEFDDENTPAYYKILDNFFSFTQEGLEELTKPFAKVGINIHQIKDYESYLSARQAIAPYFTDRLLERLNKRPPHLENDILKALARFDFAEADRLKKRLERRYQLGLKAV